MMRTIATVTTALILLTSITGQVNEKGVFQVGLASSVGVFATRFESKATLLGVTVENSDEDGAGTVSFPLEVQYGLSKKVSLGIYIEPGSYLDSNASRSNGFAAFGISPRYYLVNKDRLALLLNADLGFTALRIKETESGQSITDSYAGGHFRLGAMVQYYFGKTFGLNFGIKYSGHRMSWRDRDPEDAVLKSLNYEAVLRTSGLQFQLGAQVRL